VNDPADRELTMSCGAALLTLRVAAAHQGLRADVALLPEPSDGDLLARVTLTATDEVDAALAALFPAVTSRRTHRGASTTTGALDADLVQRMVHAVTAEKAALSFLGPEARARVAELVDVGDRAQFADRRWRRELASWMHPRRAGDGADRARGGAAGHPTGGHGSRHGPPHRCAGRRARANRSRRRGAHHISRHGSGVAAGRAGAPAGPARRRLR
jgi:hypothetical protein